MAPGSIFHHTIFYFPSYKFLIYYFAIFYVPIYKPKNTKNIYFTCYHLYHISLLQVTVKGSTTPLSRWVQVGVCLCRYSGACVLSPTGLIPWFTTTEGNTYSTLLHHPFLFKGKTNASSRGSTLFKPTPKKRGILYLSPEDMQE